jgi:hypothetical protein
MDFCGQCQRRVHNLDSMSEDERIAFLTACSGDVCVSYTVKRARTIPAALGIGVFALAASSGAFAGNESSAPAMQNESKFDWGKPTGAECPPAKANSVALSDEEFIEIEAGGVSAGDKLQWVDESELNKPDKADLPIIAASEWLPTPKN